jgi:hypothetical protein
MVSRLPLDFVDARVPAKFMNTVLPYNIKTIHHKKNLAAPLHISWKPYIILLFIKGKGKKRMSDDTNSIVQGLTC